MAPPEQTGTHPPTCGFLPTDIILGNPSPQQAEQLVAYLTELARTRAIALTVPTAFNALAFGYDLPTRRYTSSHIDADHLPLATLEETVAALPTGALVRLGTASTPLPCEVLYREGEHPQIQPDGTLPSWLSGAPQGAHGPLHGDNHSRHGTVDANTDHTGTSLLVRERLVLDVNALTPDGRARARRLDERWITEEGHLVVHSRYDDPEHADMAEARLYARYLLTEQPRLLAQILCSSGVGPEDPDEWTTTALARALHTALATVEDLLGLSTLIQWRESWLHPDTLHAFTAARHGVGTADIHNTAHGLAKDALPRNVRGGMQLPARPAYLALGPALRCQHTDADAVRGIRYATTIACANLTLAGMLENNDGAVQVNGSRVHLRLDDAFQGGGIWRAEQVDADQHLDPVDLPLALGWRDAAQPPVPQQRTGAPASPTPGSTPSPTPADAGEPNTTGFAEDTPSDNVAHSGEHAKNNDSSPDPEQSTSTLPPPPDTDPVDRRSDDTLKSWTFTYTQRARDNNAIPVTPNVSDTMHDHGLASAPLQVRISHPGIDPELRQQPVTLADRRLNGLRWPPQLFIGMRLIATWSLDGYFITVDGIPLDEPVIVDGIPLDFAYDEEVLLRSWGAPADVNDPDTLLNPATVLQVLRRAGLRAPGPSLQLYLPWAALLHHLHADPRAADLSADELSHQTARCIDQLRLRSTMNGSVHVEWATPVTSDDESTDGTYQRPVNIANRGDRPLETLWVTLRLVAKPSGRPSLKPAAERDAVSVAGSLRRGHPRVLTRGTPSAAKRAELIAWAEAHGYDRTALHPRATFVEQTSVRRYRR